MFREKAADVWRAVSDMQKKIEKIRHRHLAVKFGTTQNFFVETEQFMLLFWIDRSFKICIICLILTEKIEMGSSKSVLFSKWKDPGNKQGQAYTWEYTNTNKRNTNLNTLRLIAFNIILSCSAQRNGSLNLKYGKRRRSGEGRTWIFNHPLVHQHLCLLFFFHRLFLPLLDEKNCHP